MNRRADGLAQPPHTHRRGGLEKHAPVFGSLLWADRDDVPAVPNKSNNGVPLRHRERQRLFDVHIEARSHRIRDHSRVPVIRRSNRHRVRGFTHERLAINRVSARRVGLDTGQMPETSFERRPVHISSGHQLCVSGRADGDRGAAVAHPDRDEPWSGGGWRLRPRFARPQNDRGDRRRAEPAQGFAACARAAPGRGAHLGSGVLAVARLVPAGFSAISVQ